jgi:hypothetical protein
MEKAARTCCQQGMTTACDLAVREKHEAGRCPMQILCQSNADLPPDFHAVRTSRLKKYVGPITNRNLARGRHLSDWQKGPRHLRPISEPKVAAAEQLCRMCRPQAWLACRPAILGDLTLPASWPSRTHSMRPEPAPAPDNELQEPQRLHGRTAFQTYFRPAFRSEALTEIPRRPPRCPCSGGWELP